MGESLDLALEEFAAHDQEEVEQPLHLRPALVLLLRQFAVFLFLLPDDPRDFALHDFFIRVEPHSRALEDLAQIVAFLFLVHLILVVVQRLALVDLEVPVRCDSRVVGRRQSRRLFDFQEIGLFQVFLFRVRARALLQRLLGQFFAALVVLFRLGYFRDGLRFFFVLPFCCVLEISKRGLTQFVGFRCGGRIHRISS